MNAVEMAKQMGVTEGDVNSFLRSIVSSMQADGSEKAFLEANDEMQTELTIAYAEDVVKKSTEFTNRYFSDTSFKKDTQDKVKRIIG